MTTYTAANLRDEALANLGIIQQTDASATYTRAQLVVEALSMLGINYQPDTSATLDRAALVNNVAFILGANSTGQTLSADDYAAIDLRIDSIVGDLNARAIVTITASAIPGSWFDALSSIVASVCKDKYGIIGDEATKLQAEAATAERKLKMLNRASIVDGDIPAVIADLNARGVCTITNLAAIPGAWFQSLADIVAYQVSTKCEVDDLIVKRVMQQALTATRTLKNLSRTYIIDRNLDGILANLAARGIVYLVNQADIPQEWFVPLAAVVADYCKGKGFELDPGTLQRVTIEGQRAIAELREITREGPSYLPMQGTYY